MTIGHDEASAEELEKTRSFNELVRTVMAQTPDLGTVQGIEAMRAMPPLPGQEPLDDTDVVSIPTRAGEIDGRIRRPSEQPPRAVYLDIHGGGWCLGDPARADQTNQALADAIGVTVVSIDYRLAPEHPWPACADDCEDAARWLLAAAADLGAERLLIGGGSAGAHLAAVTLLRLRDEGADHRRFVAANLANGAFDLSLTPSARSMTDALVIPTADIEHFLRYVFPGLSPEDRRDPAISPLYADLAGLTPSLCTVGRLDPLIDDSLFLSGRWEVAGGRSHVEIYEESVHGFAGFPTAIGRRATGFIYTWLTARLDETEVKAGST